MTHAYRSKTLLSAEKRANIEVLHYWAGYIHADGGIYERARAEEHWKKHHFLMFAQVNPEPVVALHAFLEAKGVVSTRTRTSNFGEYTMHQFSTSRNIDFFIENGVKHALSYELKCSWHFWRGMFDGDGTVSWVKNGGRMYPAIQLGGRLEDMEAFNAMAEPIVGMPMKIRPCRSIFTLGRNGTSAVRLVKKMWGENCEFYSSLPYKREAAKEIILWKTSHGNSKGKQNG